MLTSSAISASSGPDDVHCPARSMSNRPSRSDSALEGGVEVEVEVEVDVDEDEVEVDGNGRPLGGVAVLGRALRPELGRPGRNGGANTH